ncbi:MAG: pyrimidine-nucleoside phosphorylase [Firmicutes bacterium]|nr:pyrimidine-nucleoside phosphorylase [Bacillota bacterium]
MRFVDILEKKRDGQALTTEEINFMIRGYVAGEIPDYQMSALCMAIYFQGMTRQETIDLTMSMVHSGDTLDLSGIPGIKVDKHSTGGVGDKTTLVLGPLVAACGAPVAKMSGKGLGHTGGTIDKLAAIPGFSSELSTEEFVQQVRNIGIAVAGQTKSLAPADKQLYSLRDVTATVDSIPLIASSIMSKKLAAGADGFVLDVKVGSGAFMQDLSQAQELAETMVGIGQGAGRSVVAYLTAMDQPLGYAVGNSLEVIEAIETLKGQGPSDLTELCLTLGSEMLVMAKQADSIDQARDMLDQAIASGAALDKFRQLIVAQGGDPGVIDDFSLLPQATYRLEVKSDHQGYVAGLDARTIGNVSMHLGAGRRHKDDAIDLSAGVLLHKKVDDLCRRGETLATLHSAKPIEQALVDLVQQAFGFSEAADSSPLVLERIAAE